ncbi:MAG TPA: hypothetical protein VH682_04735, partial [Gemmataceae bacterium]
HLQLDAGSSMTSIASYLQTSAGTLVVQATGPGINSVLVVLGNAQLSGTLEMDFVGGYVPAPGDSFVVVDAGSITAHFDTTPDNMTVGYGPNTVGLTEN